VFPDELVRDRTANALIGEYSLEEGAAILLEGTGLIPSFSNPIVLNITIDDTSTSGEKAVNATKKAGLIAIIAGALGGGVNAQESREADGVTQTSIVTGKVTDARTGSNLRGARVEIEETGEWTSAGELGRFRFVNVPNGPITLTVSFLGYAEQSAVVAVRGDRVTQDFALRGGGEIEEIVVLGQRSARAQALNRERTAPNVSTVVSSDLLGNFPGTTISEALRRVPGVAFQQDFDTGDGTNIVIRGLNPDLNTVTFNGIELPEGSGEGRSASLNNILADSVKSVTISKTLLPSQDSSGAGGLVEIETRSALDNPDRFASFLVEDRRRADDFVDDFVASGQISGRFGRNRDFGLGVSVQYRDRNTQALSARTPLSFGQYLPLDADGGLSIRLPSAVPPGNPFPFEDTPGADVVYANSLAARYRTEEIADLAIGVNAAWDLDHTVLRLDYQNLSNERSSSFIDYNIRFPFFYAAREVEALGGETRNALTLFPTSTTRANTFYSISDDITQETDVLSLRGETSYNKFDFRYTLGYTNGTQEFPLEQSLFGSFRVRPLPDGVFSDAAIDPVEGRILSVFPTQAPGDDFLPVPLLTEDGFALFSDPSSYRVSSGNLTRERGETERYSADLSSRYNHDGNYLKYVELGFQFEESSFQNRQARSSFFSPVGADLSDLSVQFDREILEEVGINTGILTPSLAQARQFFSSLDQFEGTGVLVVSDFASALLADQTETTETEFAPFLQARVDIGSVEIVGGFRYSVIEVDATNVNRPTFQDASGARDTDFEDNNSRLVTDSATQRQWLPRLLVNFRPTEEWVVRAGYYRSVSRPSILQLSGDQRISLSLVSGPTPIGQVPTLSVSEGNEGLEPAITDSVDLSVERYFDDAGVIKAGLFYKNIQNLFESTTIRGDSAFDGVNLPDFTVVNPGLDLDGFDITDAGIRAAVANGEIFVNRNRPVNNEEDASIWGIELTAERQLGFLPDLFDGLGVYANYTYTDSEKSQPVTYTDSRTFEAIDLVVDGVRFNEQPEHSGTFGITYQNYGVDSILLYSYQDRRQTSFAINGLSQFEDESDSLDFRLTYLLERFGGRYQLIFEATDLLRGTGDPTLTRSQGDGGSFPVYINDRSYLGGREFRVGIRATF